MSVKARFYEEKFLFTTSINVYLDALEVIELHEIDINALTMQK
jgi:hypothetical protein